MGLLAYPAAVTNAALFSVARYPIPRSTAHLEIILVSFGLVAMRIHLLVTWLPAEMAIAISGILLVILLGLMMMIAVEVKSFIQRISDEVR